MKIVVVPLPSAALGEPRTVSLGAVTGTGARGKGVVDLLAAENVHPERPENEPEDSPPRARELFRQGAVYGLAGAIKAADIAVAAARGAVRGAKEGVADRERRDG